MKKKSIIFVCTGNTCRSPMAEIILKTKLKNAGITDVKVSSAGLCASLGEKMSKNSSLALKELGYKPIGFKSKPLTLELINKATMLVCMTNGHKNQLIAFNKAYTISELCSCADVLDPYGQSLEIYVKTARQIEDACEKILNKIIKVKGEN